MKLSNRAYDILKWVAIIALPAIATFVVAIFEIWDIPFANEIAQTITAIATLIGALLCVSSMNYKADEELEDITDAEFYEDEDGDSE